MSAIPFSTFFELYSRSNHKLGNSFQKTKGSDVFLEHGIVNDCSDVYVVSKTSDFNTLKSMLINGEKYVQVFTHWRQIVNTVNKDFTYRNYNGKIYILVFKFADVYSVLKVVQHTTKKPIGKKYTKKNRNAEDENEEQNDEDENEHQPAEGDNGVSEEVPQKKKKQQTSAVVIGKNVKNAPKKAETAENAVAAPRGRGVQEKRRLLLPIQTKSKRRRRLKRMKRLKRLLRLMGIQRKKPLESRGSHGLIWQMIQRTNQMQRKRSSQRTKVTKKMTKKKNKSQSKITRKSQRT